MNLINVADIVNPASGLTYRQENMAKGWNIPLGSLVEILKYNFKTREYEDDPFGLRLYVVKQGRDCDGTPLYWLAYETAEEYEDSSKFFEGGVFVAKNKSHWNGELLIPKATGGYGEKSLKVLHINPPQD